MLQKIKSIIPFSLKLFLRKLYYFGNKHYCNCCNSNISRFKSGGQDIPVIAEKQIIGMGFRQNDWCPVCKASDKQRIVKLYLDQIEFFKTLKKEKKKILHIAPAPCWASVFSKYKGTIDYITGDLKLENYLYYYKKIVRLDITDLSFTNNEFDVIICNHVLEHIEEDKKAIIEIFRVLKPGGFAILQVPYSAIITKTLEDSSIKSDADRLKNYGQKDHVRIYARDDYIKRLEASGFKVDIFKPDNIKPDLKGYYKNITRLCLFPDEELVIVYKVKTLNTK